MPSIRVNRRAAATHIALMMLKRVIIGLLISATLIIVPESFASACANSCGAVATLTGFAGTLSQDGNFWQGEYGFGEDGGKTAGGSRIYVYHTIKIYRDHEQWLAEIESNGFQTARQLVCNVKVRDGRALLYFKSYGETNMFKPYREGQLLLTLERAIRSKKPTVLTYWGAFEPAVKPLKSGRVYFTKIHGKRSEKRGG